MKNRSRRRETFICERCNTRKPAMRLNQRHCDECRADPISGRYTVDEKGCWIWGMAISSGGYGVVGVGPEVKYAHRVSYEIHVGKIPPRLHIDHLCRNRTCCNPDHLEAVAPAVNTLRGMSPRVVAARRGECVNGHRMTGENTYIRPDNGGKQCRTCRRQRKREFLARRRKEVAA